MCVSARNLGAGLVSFCVAKAPTTTTPVSSTIATAILHRRRSERRMSASSKTRRSFSLVAARRCATDAVTPRLAQPPTIPDAHAESTRAARWVVRWEVSGSAQLVQEVGRTPETTASIRPWRDRGSGIRSRIRSAEVSRPSRPVRSRTRRRRSSRSCRVRLRRHPLDEFLTQQVDGREPARRRLTGSTELRGLPWRVPRGYCQSRLYYCSAAHQGGGRCRS